MEQEMGVVSRRIGLLQPLQFDLGRGRFVFGDGWQGCEFGWAVGRGGDGSVGYWAWQCGSCGLGSAGFIIGFKAGEFSGVELMAVELLGSEGLVTL